MKSPIAALALCRHAGGQPRLGSSSDSSSVVWTAAQPTSPSAAALRAAPTDSRVIKATARHCRS